MRASPFMLRVCARSGRRPSIVLRPVLEHRSPKVDVDLHLGVYGTGVSSRDNNVQAQRLNVISISSIISFLLVLF